MHDLLQLIVHGVGDFYSQSDWMAMNKPKATLPCLVHVLLYTACFLFLTINWKALLLIAVSHFIIDRWHTLLKRLIWLKNHIGPTWSYPEFKYCQATGYYDDAPHNPNKPDEATISKFGPPRYYCVTQWLYIICDNLLHLLCNYWILFLFV